MAIADTLKKSIQRGVQSGAKMRENTSKNLSSVKNSTPKASISVQPPTKWYSGDLPTARETGAQMYRVGMQNPSQQAELNRMFEAELVNPNGPIYSPYLKANSTNFTQTNQKNTYNAGAEWAEYQNELRYWAGRTDRNYSDDEIIRKIDMKKYPTLAKMDESAAMGQPMALLADIGYSQDAKYGVLWAARNPDASTGDAFMDSIQGTLGRGNQHKANDVSSWRDATSNSYAPYKAGATALDDLAYKYGMDGDFDMEWLNGQQGLVLLNGDEQMRKDYNRIYEVVTQTDKIEEELQKYRAEVNSAIAAGMDPRAVFNDGMMAEEYPELWKAYEGQRSGKLTETSRALDFDFNADVLAVQDAYLKKTGTMDDADFANDVAALLGLPTLNNDKQKAVTRQTNAQLQAAGSIFAQNFTPAEASAMYTASAGYMPTKHQMAQAILNGTAGENEAYTSAMDAANAYATEFWLNSVNRLKELENHLQAFDEYDALVKEWDEVRNAENVDENARWEYEEKFAALEPQKSVWASYENRDELVAAIENEKRIQANVLQRFADAEKHNTTGAAGKSVMPLLTFVNEFSGYEGGQRYANTAWGEAIGKGESWEKVSADINQQEKNNVQLLRMIETALRQAGEYGLNADYTKGLKAFRDELLSETQLIQYDKLRGNADFEATVKGFSVPPNTNPILMVMDDPETFYRTADEQTLTFGAPVSRMTDDEKALYKYVFATQGPEAAADYYSMLEPMLNVRMSNEAEEQAKADADDAWFGGTVMSALANLGGTAGMLDNALKTISGQEVDPYGMNFLGQRYSQTVREEVKKNIDENFGAWADVLKLGYDVLATSMDQGTALAAGGGMPFFSLALQSGSAGNAALMDAYLMGGNDLQAWGKAGVATLAEYLTEKGPLGDLLDAFANGGTGVFKEILKRRMIAEGIGEGLSEIVNTISDNVIMQELSQYNALVEQYMAEGYTEKLAKRMAGGETFTNILYSGFLGSVSAAPTTAASYAAGALNKRTQNRFKSRAEAALSKAQSDGAGKPAQAAAMAAAMEAGGSNPEDADAAASAMVQADPQATYTLWSILDHSTDFEAVPAVELGALVPDSQTGNLFAMIKEEGATDENVAQLIETANQEMADPEVKARYDAAIASYAEGTSTISAMVGADLSGIQNAQKNAENAGRTLQTARTSLEAARANMKSASTVLQNAQKRFSNDHGDKATAAVIKAKERYQKAQQALESAKQTESFAQKDYDAAKVELETMKQNTLTEIRQQGVTARDQIMANRQAVQELKAVEAEEKREADNALSLEADNFVNTYFDTAPEDVRADLKERYMAYDGETRKVTRDMSSFASQISKKFNLSIKFTDSHSIFEGAYTGGNQIVLDKNATQGDVIKRVLVHEITHAAETSNAYNELADAVLEAYYGDNKKQIEVDIEAKSKQYAEAAGQDGADIARSELVAERLAEMLSGNQKAMDRLVAEKPAVATRIWRAIKEFIGKMTGVQNSELDKFIQLEKKLEKALKNRYTGEGTKFQLVDKNGNAVILTNEDIWENMNAVANMGDVVSLEGNPHKKNPDKDFLTMAQEYFDEIGRNAVSPVFGNVYLANSGLRHLTNVGVTSRRSALLRAVKPVIENGKLVHIENNHDNNGFDTAMVAAPVSVDGQPFYMGVIIKQGNGGDNSYYMHDAVLVEKNNGSTPTQLGKDGDAVALFGENPSMASILGNLANFKSEFQETESNVTYLDNSVANPTGSEAFKRWFGESRVVNSDGTPKAMYRGDTEDIEVFDRKKSKSSNLYGRGFYFTDSEAHANQYGDARSYYLRIEKPLNAASGEKKITMKQMRAFLEAVAEDDDYGLENYGYGATVDSVLEALKGKADFEGLQDVNATAIGDFVAAIELFNKVNNTSYDGIVTPTETVVFDSRQIKSATDNIGTFDANNPNVKFSLPSPDIINRQMAAYRESQQMDIPEGMGQRQFAGQTVQNSSAVPEEYKPTFMMPENLMYAKDTNREQVERAWQRIQENGFEAEYNRLLEKEDVYDADDTAEANLMMAMALNPNTSDPSVFMSLALRYNEKGTENAQALQARQLFKKMTPTGAQVWVAGKAEKELKERRRTHQPEAKMVDNAAQAVADFIKDKQGGDELLRVPPSVRILYPFVMLK